MTEKLTIIKILANDGHPTQEDIDKWRKIFEENRMTVQEAMETGEVFVEFVPVREEENYITLVRIGGDDYKPTFEDLESWRQIFEEAKADPNFKIFTHPAVEIDVINIGKIVAVE